MIKAILGFFTGGTSIWLPYVIVAVIIAGLGASLWIEHDRLVAAKAQIVADQDTITAAKRERDVSKADADRWIAYSKQQTDEIASLNKQLAQHVADAQAADAAAEDLRQRQEQQLSMLQIQLATLEEKARAHPDQTRALGPLVIDIVRSSARPGRAQANSPGS